MDVMMSLWATLIEDKSQLDIHFVLFQWTPFFVSQNDKQPEANLRFRCLHFFHSYCWNFRRLQELEESLTHSRTPVTVTRTGLNWFQDAPYFLARLPDCNLLAESLTTSH